MNQARNLGPARQFRAAPRTGAGKPSRVKTSGRQGGSTSLNLAVQPRPAFAPANCTAAPSEFLRHPELASRASAAIAGRAIGRILVFRKD